MADTLSPNKIGDKTYPNRKEEESFSSFQKKGHEVYSPRTIKDQMFPRKIIAQEVRGSMMNTMAGQIYRELNFNEDVNFQDD